MFKDQETESFFIELFFLHTIKLSFLIKVALSITHSVFNISCLPFV